MEGKKTKELQTLNDAFTFVFLALRNQHFSLLDYDCEKICGPVFSQQCLVVRFSNATRFINFKLVKYNAEFTMWRTSLRFKLS